MIAYLLDYLKKNYTEVNLILRALSFSCQVDKENYVFHYIHRMKCCPKNSVELVLKVNIQFCSNSL